MISAGLGRYGPFVLHDGTYANLDSIEDVFSIGLNRAVTVIAEKQSKGKGGRDGGTPAALKELGDHPDGGGKIIVRDGKYGPYVNFGKVNATLPKGKDPQSVTMEDALALIAEKEAKGGGGKKPVRKAAAAKAPAAKKTAAKSRPRSRPRRKKGRTSVARRITGRSHGDPRTADTQGQGQGRLSPSRDEILRYIAENPDRAGKRDIAKAFALRATTASG